MNSTDVAAEVSRLNHPDNRDDPTVYPAFYVKCPTCRHWSKLTGVTVRQAYEGEQRHEGCRG